MNSHGNRRKLVKFVFSVHRNSLALLPYYSRLIATLNTVFKDMGKNKHE